MRHESGLGLAKVVPTSWSIEMDGGPNILQWSYTASGVHDRCGRRRYTNEQDERGCLQLDRGDGTAQLLVVK